jgi:Tfp pilus assembly protein PilF
MVFLNDPLSADEHVRLGVAYEERGEWDRAIAEYEAALKIDRRQIQALVNMGNVYTQQHRYPEAERYFQKALELNPAHSMANNNMAWILIAQGFRLNEAERLIQRAIDSDPGRLPVFLDTRAHLYLRQGRFSEAMDSVVKAEEHLTNEDPSLRSDLAATRRLITQAMESASNGLPLSPAGGLHSEGAP